MYCDCSPLHQTFANGKCYCYNYLNHQETNQLCVKNKENISTCNKSMCNENENFPCAIDQNYSYRISDICNYNLNHLQVLIPCNTGEHIQNCKLLYSLGMCLGWQVGLSRWIWWIKDAWLWCWEEVWKYV